MKSFLSSAQKSRRSLSTVASFKRLLSPANYHKTEIAGGVPISRKFRYNPCQTRWLYTETDQDMSQHIAKEIENEKKSAISKASDYFKDWKITPDGCEISMSRKEGNESITIEFNVNNATDLVDEGSSDFNVEETNEMPQMICRPPFIVEIGKPSGTKIRISCQFVSELEADDGDEQDVRDKFEIVQFSVTKGDILPSTYVCSGETMDGEMYEKLMDMLDERKIDNEFAKELIDIGTRYEHKEYIKFLSTFKAFVDEK